VIVTHHCFVVFALDENPIAFVAHNTHISLYFSLAYKFFVGTANNTIVFVVLNLV